MNEPDEKVRFKDLYLSWAPDLVATAARYVGMPAAEDLVQELFLKVWNKKIFLRVKSSELHYFLFSSIRNACLNTLKHEDVKRDFVDYYTKSLLIEELSGSEVPFYYAEEEDTLNNLFREINKLPPRCKEIVIASYIDGKTAVEIAQEKEISRRTVEAQLYKALKILRDALTLIILFFSVSSK